MSTAPMISPTFPGRTPLPSSLIFSCRSSTAIKEKSHVPAMLLRLRQSIAGTCDFSLIAVEDRQLKISEDGSGVLPGNVGEIIGAVHVDFGVRFGQEDLALGGGYPQFSGTEVRSLAQRPRLQVVEVPLEWLKF